MDQMSHDLLSAPDGYIELDDAGRNRNQARDSLFLMAEYRLTGSRDVRSVRIRNLSSGGLMAEMPAGLPQGQAIEFDVRGVGRIGGKVAWFAAGRVGITFDAPIDPMLARKPVGGGVKASHIVMPPRPRR